MGGIIKFPFIANRKKLTHEFIQIARDATTYIDIKCIQLYELIHTRELSFQSTMPVSVIVAGQNSV
jgi:hypothetical protein